MQDIRVRSRRKSKRQMDAAEKGMCNINSAHPRKPDGGAGPIFEIVAVRREGKEQSGTEKSRWGEIMSTKRKEGV